MAQHMWECQMILDNGIQFFSTQQNKKLYENLLSHAYHKDIVPFVLTLFNPVFYWLETSV